MIVVYILLFIVFLSLLIMIHEMGHLLTAKMFKVYCFEYAIGFGPKLFSFKRKNGETYFSLRAIPFGGFVSMYGESETVPEGLEIDPSRSLLSIAKWKRAIIMVAGVTMNFLLAILMFFVYEVGFPVYTPHYAHITVSENSLAYNAGLRSDDLVYSEVVNVDNSSLVFYDDEAIVNYADNSSEQVFFGFNYGTLSLKDTSLVNHAVMYKSVVHDNLNITTFTDKTVSQIASDEIIDENENVKVSGYISQMAVDDDQKVFSFLVNETVFDDNAKKTVFTVPYNDKTQRDALNTVCLNSYITVIGNVFEYEFADKTTVRAVQAKDNNYLFISPDLNTGNLLTKDDVKEMKKISFEMVKIDENNNYQHETFIFNEIELTKNGNTYSFPDNLGLHMQLTYRYNNFGEAVGNAFVDFGDGAILIFKSLGTLLTSAESWKEVGGIIAIGVVSTQTLQMNGFGPYLRLWAIISVNLGIVNLLPFPGLDGWQLLVTAIEGITRKEVPTKFKSIASIIGIALLFALMIAIIVKDVFTFFI